MTKATFRMEDVFETMVPEGQIGVHHSGETGCGSKNRALEAHPFIKSTKQIKNWKCCETLDYDSSSQWHISSSKAAPPKSLQRALPTGDPVSKVQDCGWRFSLKSPYPPPWRAGY